MLSLNDVFYSSFSQLIINDRRISVSNEIKEKICKVALKSFSKNKEILDLPLTFNLSKSATDLVQDYFTAVKKGRAQDLIVKEEVEKQSPEDVSELLEALWYSLLDSGFEDKLAFLNEKISDPSIDDVALYLFFKAVGIDADSAWLTQYSCIKNSFRQREINQEKNVVVPEDFMADFEAFLNEKISDLSIDNKSLILFLKSANIDADSVWLTNYPSIKKSFRRREITAQKLFALDMFEGNLRKSSQWEIESYWREIFKMQVSLKKIALTFKHLDINESNISQSLIKMFETKFNGVSIEELFAMNRSTNVVLSTDVLKLSPTYKELLSSHLKAVNAVEFNKILDEKAVENKFYSTENFVELLQGDDLKRLYLDIDGVLGPKILESNSILANKKIFNEIGECSESRPVNCPISQKISTLFFNVESVAVIEELAKYVEEIVLSSTWRYDEEKKLLPIEDVRKIFNEYNFSSKIVGLTDYYAHTPDEARKVFLETGGVSFRDEEIIQDLAKRPKALIDLVLDDDNSDKLIAAIERKNFLDCSQKQLNKDHFAQAIQRLHDVLMK